MSNGKDDSGSACIDLLSGDKRYNIIYADPPWEYPYSPLWKRGGAEQHYETQKAEWIANLPIERIRAWDSALFLWATMPRLEEALYVLRCWGFDYRGVAFVWVKTNKKSPDPYFGMGKWTRQNAELVLLGMHGRMERQSASVSSIVQHPVLGHSRKPDIVRDRIVELLGDLPRIELFGRSYGGLFPKPDGWDCWGNEIESDIELPTV